MHIQSCIQKKIVTGSVQMVAWNPRKTYILKNALSQGKRCPLFIAYRRFSFAIPTTFQNRLINMYAKCGSLIDARKMFNHMKERDSVSWNTIIVTYRRYEDPHEAVALFHQMQRRGFHPNELTFASVIPACAKMGGLEQGMDIHLSIKDREILSNLVVANALVDMYAKCGRLDKARDLFDRMPQRDVISWTAMISGYVQNGDYENALEIFKQMQLTGVKPNSTTFASILPSCAKMGAVEHGTAIHQSVTEGGFLSDVVVVSALVDMYAKCGSIDKACELFGRMPQRNVVSWTAMTVGYAQNGLVEKSLETFKQMKLEGVKPNSRTFVSILTVCAKIEDLELGMGIHQSIVEGEFLSDVVENALVDMYAKCGSINRAYKVLNKMPQRNVVSWTTMIVGYVHNGFVEKALETFMQMQLEGVEPNSTTLASILPACARMGALKQGMTIHQSIVEREFLSDIVVAIALIDMYAKCGSIDKACRLFDKIPQKDVVSWNAMIIGYAQNGMVENALEIFKQMQLTGVKPDATTFANILPACAKMGTLEQGMDIHQSIMDREFLSDVVVANALVDMYAKCGRIDKACELFDKIPERNVVSWTAMIAGYAQNGSFKDALKNFELMKHCGIYPDTVSFSCVLFACSHSGLVDEGCTYFNEMSNHYCIAPTGDHYMCMVDLLSRAGYLEDTLNFIIKMPVIPSVVVWICFLGACRLHRNIGLGVFTATLLFDLDPKNTAAYVLLSNIYAEVGCWSEVQMVRRLMKDRGIVKIPGCSWIEVHKTIHTFRVGDSSHPDTGDLCKVGEIGLGDEGRRVFSRLKAFD